MKNDIADIGATIAKCRDAIEEQKKARLRSTA